MSPLAVAERAESTANEWSALRKHLSEREWDRFNLEVYEARRGSPEEFKHLLESWIITIAMRGHATYQEQYERFLAALRTT